MLLNIRKRRSVFAAPPWIVGIVYTILGNNCLDPLESESSQFLVVGNAREGSVEIKVMCKTALLLGPWEPTNPMILEIYYR